MVLSQDIYQERLRLIMDLVALSHVDYEGRPLPEHLDALINQGVSPELIAERLPVRLELARAYAENYERRKKESLPSF